MILWQRCAELGRIEASVTQRQAVKRVRGRRLSVGPPTRLGVPRNADDADGQGDCQFYALSQEVRQANFHGCWLRRLLKLHEKEGRERWFCSEQHFEQRKAPAE
jgi:hypothetical protein